MFKIAKTHNQEVLEWQYLREEHQKQEKIKDRLNKSTYVECPNCHEPMLPHRVCPSCGYHKGKEVLELN